MAALGSVDALGACEGSKTHEISDGPASAERESERPHQIWSCQSPSRAVGFRSSCYVIAQYVRGYYTQRSRLIARAGLRAFILTAGRANTSDLNTVRAILRGAFIGEFKSLVEDSRRPRGRVSLLSKH